MPPLRQGLRMDPFQDRARRDTTQNCRELTREPAHLRSTRTGDALESDL
jgi:hypothetical protein